MINTVSLAAIAAASVMIVLGVMPAWAQTDPADLYDLARQAQIEVEIQMNPDSPDVVGELLVNGTAKTEAILNSTTTEEAGEHFLAAMQFFKDAIRLLSESSGDQGDGGTDMVADLDRLGLYYDRLRDLARGYGIDDNSDTIGSLFELASEQVSSGDPEASDTIEDIRRLVGIVHEGVVVTAALEDRTRAADYADWYQKQLDRMISGAESSGISTRVIGELQDIRRSLANATEPDDIISHIQDFLAIKEGLSLGQNDHLKVWALYLDDTIREFWQDEILDLNQYTAVVKTLDRARNMLSGGNLIGAEELLWHIDRWLFDLN